MTASILNTKIKEEEFSLLVQMEKNSFRSSTSFSSRKSSSLLPLSSLMPSSTTNSLLSIVDVTASVTIKEEIDDQENKEYPIAQHQSKFNRDSNNSISHEIEENNANPSIKSDLSPEKNDDESENNSNHADDDGQKKCLKQSRKRKSSDRIDYVQNMDVDEIENQDREKSRRSNNNQFKKTKTNDANNNTVENLLTEYTEVIANVVNGNDFEERRGNKTSSQRSLIRGNRTQIASRRNQSKETKNKKLTKKERKHSRINQVDRKKEIYDSHWISATQIPKDRSKPAVSIRFHQEEGRMVLLDKCMNTLMSTDWKANCKKRKAKIQKERVRMNNNIFKINTSKLADGERKWCCFLCQKKCHENNLGFLYGPYQFDPKYIDLFPLVYSDFHGMDIWFHEDCYFWSGLPLQSPYDPINLFSYEDFEEFMKTKCFFCNLKGASIQCSALRCSVNSFHFPCALESGYYFRSSDHRIFCPKHAENLSLSKDELS
ncbi:ankyrin repeat domain-containing protein 6 [Sarcoptes scabiei]|nr:ankyrin repeat domain-containing protein 6 [Sarcoptes scabiei]